MKNGSITSKTAVPIATATIVVALLLLFVLIAGQLPVFVNAQDVPGQHLGSAAADGEHGSLQAPLPSKASAWIWCGTGLLIATAAAISLFRLIRHIRLLRDAIAETHLQAANELGRLASGLAHEVGNPLHALRLNLHTFRRVHADRRSLPREDVDQMLDESVAAIQRIESLMQRSKTFVTSTDQRLEVFDLNSELEAIVDFLSLVLQEDQVEVDLALPDQPVSIRMDRARLRQIVLNLLQNARDFMSSGGRIELEMTRRDGDVEIVVSDQGRGIAEVDLPHIFEPFFSTRDNGIGLGLALVKRFVREAGGHISCEPNQPRGTRFHVHLPAVAAGRHHWHAKSA